jgi:RNA polymerase sigma-70 factor (ECF subfamily)
MLPWMDVESEALALLGRGDAAGAADAAVRGYGPAVLGYLRSLLPEDDAHDVFGQVQEDVLRGLPGFRAECSLRAWMFRVAWHAIQRHRRDPYRARGERLPSGAGSILAAEPPPSSAMPGGRRDLLRRLRDALDPEDRTLLALRVDRELEWQEISAVLAAEGVDASSAALRKRFERLKERLARLAREQGLIA